MAFHFYSCIMITLCMTPLFRMAESGSGREGKKKSEWTPPWFDESLPDEITVTEGQAAKLVCTVHKLRGRAVSWIRKRDLHVISANALTFTSDDRFKILVNNSSSTWTLQISPSLRDDSGIYECQVNTRPKLWWPVMLTVEVPAATLEGPTERYIQSGSTLVLTCNSTLHPDALTSVIWHHNKTAINITSPRGGVSIQTVREGRHVLSRLSVVRAQPKDAGVYMCAPDLVHPANATVFVVEGEHPAAMQRDYSDKITGQLWLIIFCCILINANVKIAINTDPELEIRSIIEFLALYTVEAVIFQPLFRKGKSEEQENIPGR